MKKRFFVSLFVIVLIFSFSVVAAERVYNKELINDDLSFFSKLKAVFLGRDSDIGFDEGMNTERSEEDDASFSSDNLFFRNFKSISSREVRDTLWERCSNSLFSYLCPIINDRAGFPPEGTSVQLSEGSSFDVDLWADNALIDQLLLDDILVYGNIMVYGDFCGAGEYPSCKSGIDLANSVTRNEVLQILNSCDVQPAVLQIANSVSCDSFCNSNQGGARDLCKCPI